jgi:hypothetical protein
MQYKILKEFSNRGPAYQWPQNKIQITFNLVNKESNVIFVLNCVTEHYAMMMYVGVTFQFSNLT